MAANLEIFLIIAYKKPGRQKKERIFSETQCRALQIENPLQLNGHIPPLQMTTAVVYSSSRGAFDLDSRVDSSDDESPGLYKVKSTPPATRSTGGQQSYYLSVFGFSSYFQEYGPLNKHLQAQKLKHGIINGGSRPSNPRYSCCAFLRADAAIRDTGRYWNLLGEQGR